MDFKIRLENVSGFFFSSSFPTVSASYPCLLRVKTEVGTDIFSPLILAFREACATVNRLADSRFERHNGSLAALSAFDLKHSFLQFVESPLLALG
jgi:hypothetical protein